MPDWAVTARIGAVNGLSSVFTRMGISVQRFGQQAGLSFDHAHRRASLFKQLLGANFLGNLAANAVRRLTSEVRNLFTEGLELASNLVEVQNVVDTTYGKSAGVIDKWSRQAMTSFGLSELQAKQFTGTLGAMLKSSGLTGESMVRMSTDLSGLAGDFASFYNLDAETAFQKIRSGISGETEPLKQLGINMSVATMEAFALTQGVRKQWKEMNQAEQANLRYLYLMHASADAQGDFAKTLEFSYANQKRVLQTNIQQVAANALSAVLPLALRFTTSLNDIVTKVGEWVAANKELIQTKVEAFVQNIVDRVTEFGSWVTDHKEEIVAFWNGLKDTMGWVWEHKELAIGVLLSLKGAALGWKILSGITGIATTAKVAKIAATAATAAKTAATAAGGAAAGGLGPVATKFLTGAAGGGAMSIAARAVPVLGAAITIGKSALPMVTHAEEFAQAAKTGQKYEGEGGAALTNLLARGAWLGYHLAGLDRPETEAPNAVEAEHRASASAAMLASFENNLHFTVDNTAAPGIKTTIRPAPQTTGAKGEQYRGAK